MHIDDIDRGPTMALPASRSLEDALEIANKIKDICIKGGKTCDVKYEGENVEGAELWVHGIWVDALGHDHYSLMESLHGFEIKGEDIKFVELFPILGYEATHIESCEHVRVFIPCQQTRVFGS